MFRLPTVGLSWLTLAEWRREGLLDGRRLSRHPDQLLF